MGTPSRFWPFRIVLLFLVFLLLSGCYVLKQGLILSDYQNRAEEIDRLLQRKDLDSDTRRFLNEVVSIKQFAVENLGLENNRSYTKFVETDRNYLVDVVTACAPDSFTPYIWKFPIVGEVPYKGFYQKRDAERLARRLQKEGYDVWVRKVDAFSTLGYFSDPVYSFMKGYPLYRLADLIIHEQTHATIYIKDKPQFNEELATFVGTEGALAYINNTRGGAADLRRQIQENGKDRDHFYKLMRSLYTRLDAVYSSDIPAGEKLREKKRIIDEFQMNLKDNYSDYFIAENYRYITEMELNNAHIVSWNIYTRDLSLYRKVYESLDSDLALFIEKLKNVKNYSDNPKEYLRSLLF